MVRLYKLLICFCVMISAGTYPTKLNITNITSKFRTAGTDVTLNMQNYYSYAIFGYICDLSKYAISIQCINRQRKKNGKQNIKFMLPERFCIMLYKSYSTTVN
jgi:hypothetical protein